MEIYKKIPLKMYIEKTTDSLKFYRKYNRYIQSKVL